MQNILKHTLTFLSVLGLSACSSLQFPGVFKIDIGQGNILTQEMVDKLKVGMTPRQVEYVMGSPMITDPFHPNRWDYLYYLENGKGTVVNNRITLYFSGNRLSAIDTSHFKDPDTIKKRLAKER